MFCIVLYVQSHVKQYLFLSSLPFIWTKIEYLHGTVGRNILQRYGRDSYQVFYLTPNSCRMSENILLRMDDTGILKTFVIIKWVFESQFSIFKRTPIVGPFL